MEKTINILLIDDDDFDTRNFSRALLKSGLDVQLTTINNPLEGLNTVIDSNEVFDILFLDYKLPGSNGLSLLRSIRNHGILLPIIIVTSQGDEKVAVEMMKAGATDYIPKSLLTVDGLTQSIRNALRLHTMAMEKEQTKRELSIAENKIQSLVARSSVWLFSVDSDGVFTLSEGKTMPSAQINIYNGDEIIGLKAWEVYAEKALFTEMIRKAMGGTANSATVEAGDIIYDIECKTVFTVDNKPNGAFGVAIDNTARINTEKALVSAKQTAEKTAQIKEEFLANMSHEIRTPMNAIIGFTDILLGTTLEEEQLNYVSSIKTAGENLLVIVNDILDFTKIEAGKLIIEQSPFSLLELIESLRLLQQPRADEKAIDLSIDVHTDVPEHLVGDSVRLFQILMNLLSNAIKFTEQGWVKLTVNKTVYNLKPFLAFELEDTGIGIPEDKKEIIFNSFTQASGDTTRKYGGTGLGLTIVKRLVELISGHIELESTPGKGTTFRLYIPLQEVKDESILKTPKEEPYQDTKVLQGKIALLAEDNYMNQIVAEKYLKDWGMKVQAVEDGTEVLKAVRQQRFDVILMDIQMPEMNGIEATLRVREGNGPNANTPIIAMTANAFESEKKRCLAAGMNDYVSKPYKPATLQSIIAYALDPVTVTDRPQVAELVEPKMAEPPSDFLCDLKVLNEIAGGDDQFFQEMINTYVSTAHEMAGGIKRAYEQADLETVKKKAHKLRPSVSIIGVDEMLDIINELMELDLKTLEQDATIQQKVTLLDSLAQETVQELKHRFQFGAATR